MDLEKSIIGQVLFNPPALYQIVGKVTEECFTNISCREVWRVFEDLNERNQSVDLITVKSELERLKSSVKLKFLLECHEPISSAANIEAHSLILIEKRNKRMLRNIGMELSAASEGDKFSNEIIEEVEKQFISLSSARAKTTEISKIGLEILKQSEAAASNSGEMTGITTGFKEGDRVTNGWQPSDLVILAARPGMGKTSMALSLAVNAAKKGKRVGFFSMEMSSRQLVTRLISMYSGIPSQKIISGNIRDWEALHTAIEHVGELPIYINDEPALSPSELSAIARMWKIRQKIDILFIDYLQLMRAGSNKDNREREVAQISSGLKALAKTLDIPVIALSQLSRAVETRSGDKRPRLSDLRDSGAIEQDADIVTFLYRPEYYELSEAGMETHAEWLFAKHRNGSLADIELDFIAENTLFLDKGQNINIEKPKAQAEAFELPRMDDQNVPF